MDSQIKVGTLYRPRALKFLSKMTPSSLPFSAPEMRFATITLCVLTAAAGVYQYLTKYSKKHTNQESSPHMRTFRKYLAAYSTLRPQALLANVSSEFTHRGLPLALKLPERPVDAFKQHADIVFSLFENFEMVPHPADDPRAVHFCPETNTVIAHCNMGGKVNEDSVNGKKLVEQGKKVWWTECVLFVKMDDAGLRVMDVKEFVDSKKAEQMKSILTGVLEG